MEMESGKLFVGGISWDTSEERLKEYFEAFGEVVEAVIMKDRATGRARGFGFVVFANVSVAEKVLMGKHIIDGRKVEAKKAVPRDDHLNFNKSNGSTSSSPSPARTKKIFVGGLASTVTESDFKQYFHQYGTITDVVVMYDHNTQRPRGFGFITYDSEEAVDKVLIRTFHELNGKMVEVKRAVPKELSPGPTRSPLGGYNYGLNRTGSFNIYSPGHNGMRLDGRFSPVTVGRNGYPLLKPGNHIIGSNLDTGFGLNNGAGWEPDLGYLHGDNSYFSGNSNLNSGPIPYNVASGESGSFFSTTNQNSWANGNPNYATSSVTSKDLLGSRNENGRLVGSLGSIGDIWCRSPTSAKGICSGSLSNRNLIYGREDDNFGHIGVYTQNNIETPSFRPSYSTINNDMDPGSLRGDNSFYNDQIWNFSSQAFEQSPSLGYRPANSTAPKVTSKSSVGFMGSFSVKC